MDFVAGKSRRRVTITSTHLAATEPSIPPSRPIIVQRFNARPHAPRVYVGAIDRSFEHISTACPPQPIVAARLAGRRFAPKAVVVRTPIGPNATTTQPPYQPYIKPVAPPRLVRSPALPIKAIITHTAKAIPGPTDAIVVSRFPGNKPVRQAIILGTHPGFVNLNNFKQTTHVVPRYIVPRGNSPIVTHSLFENRPVVLPYPDPIVVPRLVSRPGGRHFIGKSAKPIIASTRSIVVPRLVPVRGKQPWNTSQPIATIYMPHPPIVAVPVRRPIIVPQSIIHSSGSFAQSIARTSQPVVSPRLVSRSRSPVPIILSANYGAMNTVPIPAIGGYLTLENNFHVLLENGSGLITEGGSTSACQLQLARGITRVIPRLTRRPRMPLLPATARTVIPPSGTPDPILYGPYDIISASIAWLRTNTSLVTTFGDSHSTGIDKFTSDTEARSINPPYAVFHEPQEAESFESKDPSGLRSSLVEGIFTIEVFSTGKLTTRQYTRQIGDWLSDAPLTFQEGTLVYIKAVDRQYPTLKESGPGTNIVMFKRAIDFEYKFERPISGE